MKCHLLLRLWSRFIHNLMLSVFFFCVWNVFVVVENLFIQESESGSWRVPITCQNNKEAVRKKNGKPFSGENVKIPVTTCVKIWCTADSNSGSLEIHGMPWPPDHIRLVYRFFPSLLLCFSLFVVSSVYYLTSLWRLCQKVNVRYLNSNQFLRRWSKTYICPSTKRREESSFILILKSSFFFVCVGFESLQPVTDVSF